MVPVEAPGRKIMNVVFHGIKLKKKKRNDPLCKPDTNKSMLKWGCKMALPALFLCKHLQSDGSKLLEFVISFLLLNNMSLFFFVSIVSFIAQISCFYLR
jgi:hypothetical protein